MRKTSDLEAVPRYVYGITLFMTMVALLLVAYLYEQNRKTLQLERQLTTFHLPSIVALNVIGQELDEIEKDILRDELSVALGKDLADIQFLRGVNRDQLSPHLYLIKTRLETVEERRSGMPGIVFESSTEQLHDSIFRLENMLEETAGANQAEAGRKFAVAMMHAQNRVEQLDRLHIKEAAKIGQQLSLMEQSSNRNITRIVVLTLLIGGVVVGRLLFLLRSSLAKQKQADSELHDYRDHLEELVAERSSELEASNRELESYSYSIAHDLRSPLRTITSFSQILQEDAALKLNNDDKQSLERIVRAGKHMAELIDDILELSRITRAKMEPDLFDLSQLAHNIASRFGELSPGRKVEWRIQDGLKVSGSRLLLEICLDNLFGNAWKYTRKVDYACIEFGAVKQKGELVYFVKDNGIGFDMQYAHKLFKPFQRLDKSGEYPGTGVGLATVERVIQRHGGSIWANSEEGNGATFMFTIPS